MENLTLQGASGGCTVFLVRLAALDHVYGVQKHLSVAVCIAWIAASHDFRYSTRIMSR